MDSLLSQQSLNVFRWEEELAVHYGAVVYLATLQKNKTKQNRTLTYLCGRHQVRKEQDNLCGQVNNLLQKFLRTLD